MRKVIRYKNSNCEDRLLGGKILIPELIPSNCFYKSPRVLVGDEVWVKIRKIVYQRALYRCEICGSNHKVEAHERYIIKNDILILKRIIAVCKACHSAIHYGLATINGKDKEALAQIMKVNNWSEEQSKMEIRKAFDDWRKLDHITEVNFDILKNDITFKNCW